MGVLPYAPTKVVCGCYDPLHGQICSFTHPALHAGVSVSHLAVWADRICIVRWMPLALGSIALEGAVWFGYGMRCPLTDWAIALGDDSGADLLSDIVLVQPVDVVSGYAAFFVLGLCFAGRRFWLESRSNHPHKTESIEQVSRHESITH